MAILVTNSAIRSKGLSRYIKQNNVPKKIKILKINGSELVKSGKFYTDKKYCRKIINKILDQKLFENNIDVVLLSSIHLPFLKLLLEKEYLKMGFIDPVNKVTKKVLLKIKDKQNKRNSLKIFASGNFVIFQRKLKGIGIKNKINFLSI